MGTYLVVVLLACQPNGGKLHETVLKREIVGL